MRRVYDVVGDSPTGITEALRQNRDAGWVHVRHEETAAFAAGAEAHVTGELAVCVGSCGPGSLHLITGCSTRIVPACRPWRSPRKSHPRR